MAILYKYAEMTELIKSRYNVTISAKKLNDMLIDLGDLVSTAIGKIETIQGRERGIQGELRNSVDGNQYWTPLYSSEAQRYVFEQALKAFPELARAVSKDEDDNRNYICGRNSSIYKRLRETYPQHIIILEGQSLFYAYDESAVKLGNACGYHIFKNSNGLYRVQIYKNRIDGILSRLKQLDLPWVMSTPENREQVHQGSLSASEEILHENRIRIGDTVVLEDKSGNIMKEYMQGPQNAAEVHLFDGLMIEDPITDPNVDMIQYGTELSNELLGKQVGEEASVRVNDYGRIITIKYKIREIISAE